MEWIDIFEFRWSSVGNKCNIANRNKLQKIVLKIFLGASEGAAPRCRNGTTEIRTDFAKSSNIQHNMETFPPKVLRTIVLPMCGT